MRYNKLVRDSDGRMGYQGDDENPYDEVKKEKAILVLQAAARGSMARRQARAMRFDVVGAPQDYVCTL